MKTKLDPKEKLIRDFATKQMLRYKHWMLVADSFPTRKPTDEQDRQLVIREMGHARVSAITTWHVVRDLAAAAKEIGLDLSTEVGEEIWRLV